MKHKIFTLLLVALTSIGTMFADKVQIGDLYYNLNETELTAEVTSKNDYYSGSVVIPESVTYNAKTYSVTSIGDWAFEGCSSLTSVTIPNSVTSIRDEAFQYCSSLTSVDIPNSVTSIGNGIFYGCSSLTSATIPNSVTSISDYTFIGCTSLTSVTIPNSVTSIGYSAFYSCSGLTSITIPNSVTSIEQYAFANCSGFPIIDNFRYADTYLVEVVDKTLSSYNIKEGTRFIGDTVFMNCCNLTSITIPNSVISIGGGAFYNCSSLTSITIPNSVTSIGGGAFSGCSSLTSVTIPNSVTSIGSTAFSGCSSLTSVTIPNSVTSIGDWAFEGCSSLTSVTIPNSVTSVGRDAFSGCSNMPIIDNIRYADTYIVEVVDKTLSSYNIKEGTRFIGDAAFKDCSNLTSITFPNGVISIGQEAFMGCTSLTSVTIPNSVTRIGWDAFNCRKLTNVYISDLAAWCNIIFGLRVFYGDLHLFLNDVEIIDLVIPNSVTSIRSYAFEGCSSLTSVTIPNSVTSIGNYTFSNCSSLTSVTIGSSVTNIVGGAFAYCSSLTSITNYATTPQTIMSSVFEKVDRSACTLYVPMECITLYREAEVWKDFNVIEPISATPTTTEDNEVNITSEDNSADITWPAVENAYTYELVIKDKQGNVICTLIFNANGQLTSIAFAAPSRTQTAAQVAGFTFTVTSLNSGSEYNYSIAAKGSQGEVLDTKSGTFTTTGDTATALDNASVESNLVKVLRNGQLLILRGDKTYTIQGQEVR